MDRALAAAGFERPALSLPDDLRPAAWGRTPDGRHWGFVFNDPTPDSVDEALAAVRRFVNAQYRTPKALRLRSPHMVLFLRVDRASAELEGHVRRASTSTIWGGEVYHLVLVERARRRVVVPEAWSTVERMRRGIFQPEALGRAFLAALH